MNDMVDRICARRSVSPRHLSDPGPSPEELKEMARAAAAAPDHGRRGPMRLVHIPDSKREALAEAFAGAALEADPQSDAARVEDARERARNGACLLAVIATISDDDPRVPPHEQWISVGSAIQNVLLAAESFGCRTKIVSGTRVTSKAMRSAFALKGSEHLVGFIAIGSFAGSPKDLPRRRADEVLSIWTAETPDSCDG
jgi:nitroreductase